VDVKTAGLSSRQKSSFHLLAVISVI
jgi:hypothetical protein